METSLVMTRCASRVLARVSGNAATSHSSRHLLRSQQLIKINSASIRGFSISAQNQQDDPSQRTPVSEIAETDSRSPTPRTPEETTQRRPQPQATRPSYSNDEDRIDLSTIPGIGADYTPPTRRNPEEARATLDALLRQSRAPRAQPPPKQPYSLDIYNQFQKPGNSGAANLSQSLADLIDPRNPASTLSDATQTAVMPLRLRPTLGRTQAVRPEAGLDLTRAFRTLEMKCNANNIKRDMNSQRFHIRRGQKKKLDKSMRWRIMFKQGFLEECGRVRRMMRQGW